jgi:hypothetical protein
MGLHSSSAAWGYLFHIFPATFHQQEAVFSIGKWITRQDGGDKEITKVL